VQGECARKKTLKEALVIVRLDKRKKTARLSAGFELNRI
jgi:hypothetical protein